MTVDSHPGRARLRVPAQVRCPQCGVTHTIAVTPAILADLPRGGDGVYRHLPHYPLFLCPDCLDVLRARCTAPQPATLRDQVADRRDA